MLNAGAELTTGAAGMYGSALKFDGQNDYLLIPDDDLFDFGANDFTLSIWVNKHETSVNNTNIGAINKWVTGSDPGDNEWHLGIGQGGNSDRPTFVFESGVDRYRVDAVNDISLNQWHHIVALREGVYLRLYVDGQLEDEENVGTVAINNAGLDMQIGYLRTNYFSSASFDNIHIYHRALSSQEVTQLYNLKSNIDQDESLTRMIAESQFGKYYRYGYQGEFAEEDGETGWNSFELRMYDGVTGRWNSIDPAGQYWSSYVGVGNNPNNLVDPDGAYSKFGAAWRNLFYGGSGTYQSGVDNGRKVWGYNKDGVAYFGSDARSLINKLKDFATSDPVFDFPVEIGNNQLESQSFTNYEKNSLQLISGSMGLSGDLKYSNLGWIADNGIRYSTKYFGRASVGLQSQAIRVAAPLKKIGVAGSLLGVADGVYIFSQGDYFNGTLNTLSSGAGFAGPYGAAWSFGWSIGGAITSIPAYQRFKHYTWMPWRKENLGY